MNTLSPRSRRPLIGLTAYREHASWGVWHTQAALLPHNYVDLLTQAGGVPVLLPLSSDEAAPQVMDMLDGLVLTGGPDIEPVRYGAAPDPYAERFQSDRDTWESALLAAALRLDRPVFGICRGMQLINVHCGGTLVQHLPELAGGQRHRPAPGVFGTVRVRLDTGSMPGSLLGPTIDVPCYHHQAVDTLGEGLKATGWALDETVEALWNPDHRFLLGVQWHPEVRDDPALFAALVRAAG